MTANVFTIPASAPFAETLARGLIDKFGAARDPLALAEARIFLPTRRAVRTLSDVFARQLGGAALLPELRPLGDVDDDEVLFSTAADDDIALLPALASLRRRFLLATLVDRWRKACGLAQRDFAQACRLADALAEFVDEAQTQEADLARLDSLVPDRLAQHWAEVRDFLVFFRDAWPAILEDEHALDPSRRRSLLLDRLGARLASEAPRGPVIAAGTTGSIPATARLLSVIARLPNGAVILPGLDRDLDEDSWNDLDPGHPQFGMKELIGHIGIARAEVRDWQDSRPVSRARARLLRETMRPAPTTDAWRAIAESGSAEIEAGLSGLSLIEAAHPGEEALAIALILREALQTAGQTAALVTPDRSLARRVAAELARWNISIDDSAGRPLAHTPPGSFLLLLADAVTDEFAPIALLALLKHPLAAGGMEPAAFRHLVRLLDMHVLRGPRPDPGFAGLRRAIDQAREDIARPLRACLMRLETILAPLCEALGGTECVLADIAEAHAKAAEGLAATPEDDGVKRMWKGEAGQAAAALFAALQEQSKDLPPIDTFSYPRLLRQLMEQQAVRPAYGSHPRLAILGPLEARLQSFDILVLGSLNEGTWPRAAAADPWLSRPMRASLDLASPERAIGLSAHDFAMLAAGGNVFLTRSQKMDGTPTVASRWLQRLVQLTAGLGLKAKLESPTPYRVMAIELENPKTYAPQGRPEPKPPLALRPRRLSVTEIETWLRDPYAIYAKHILKLSPLDPLDCTIGPLERGTAIHQILEEFLREGLRGDVAECEARLLGIADRVFAEHAVPDWALAVWKPRFRKAARWFVADEWRERDQIAQSFVELEGHSLFPGPAGAFELRCRADRIDILRLGGAAIIDYKTGRPPSRPQVEELVAPQLPLEAALLARGGFPDLGALAPQQLVYIQFGAGAEGGKRIVIDDAEMLACEAEAKLVERIAFFDAPSTPYLPRVMPFRTDSSGAYDHLARVLEWSLSGWQEDRE